MSSTKSGKIEPRYLSVPQAAAYSDLSPKALRERVHVRQVPFIKMGGSLRFDVQQLDEFMAKRAVPPINLQARR